MKHLLLLGALLPLPTLAQQPGYEIKGRIAGLPEGQRMYLIDGAQRKRIDSATVTQGQFVFRGHVAEPLHAYLYQGRGAGSSKLGDLILDNLPLTISGSQPSYGSVSTHGSADTDVFFAWFRQDEQLALARGKVIRVYKALQLRQDTAAASLKAAATELQQARIALLKTYVRQHRNAAVGAALPTMCTLLASLSTADYTEMYQALAPRWQQSAFGKEVLAQSAKRGATSPVKQ